MHFATCTYKGIGGPGDRTAYIVYILRTEVQYNLDMVRPGETRSTIAGLHFVKSRLDNKGTLRSSACSDVSLHRDLPQRGQWDLPSLEHLA